MIDSLIDLGNRYGGITPRKNTGELRYEKKIQQVHDTKDSVERVRNLAKFSHVKSESISDNRANIITYVIDYS